MPDAGPIPGHDGDAGPIPGPDGDAVGKTYVD